MSQSHIVDYIDSFEGALVAQGSGENFIAIRRLDQPFQRFDGKKASYELNHRWLSQECERENDQAWACVQGAENTYWQRKEIERLIRQLDKGNEVNVFEHFNLF